MAQTHPKVALVTGANGITGGALIEHLVKNTSSLEFEKIIATSKSSFQNTVSDPRLHFVPLDFTQGPAVLTELMRSACSEVTHAYFSSYVHKDDFQELNSSNQALFENFLQALLSAAPKLQNVTLQTGGKHYGVHLSPVPSPARENEPRRGSPADNFYFPQEDFLVSK